MPRSGDGAHRADPPVGAVRAPGGHHPATAEEAVGAIVLGMALCEVTSALTQTVLFRRYLGPRDRLAGAPLPPSTVRRKLGRIALPLGLAALLGNGISWANAVLIPRLLVLGGMDQSQAVSTYGVTFGMTLSMLLLPTAFLSALGLVLTPKLSRCAALQQAGEIRRLVRRWVSLANLILIPALALLAVLGARPGPGPLPGGAGGGSPAFAGPGGPLLLLAVPGGLCPQRGGPAEDLRRHRPGGRRGAAGPHLPDSGAVGHGGLCGELCAGLPGGAVLSWRAVAQATGLALPVFSRFTAPHPGRLPGGLLRGSHETVLLRRRRGPLPSALGGMGFGPAAVPGGPPSHGGVGRKRAAPVGNCVFPGMGYTGGNHSGGFFPAGGCGGGTLGWGSAGLGAQRPGASACSVGVPISPEKWGEEVGSPLTPPVLWPACCRSPVWGLCHIVPVVGLFRRPSSYPDLETFFHKMLFQHIFPGNASQIGLRISEETARTDPGQTTAKTSEWERAGPKRGGGGPPSRLFMSGLSESLIPPRDRAGTHVAGLDSAGPNPDHLPGAAWCCTSGVPEAALGAQRLGGPADWRGSPFLPRMGERGWGLCHR